MSTIYLRGKVYWISYYLNGKRISHSLKVKDKLLARHLKKEKEIELEKGTAKVNVRVRTSELLDKYKLYVKAHKAHKTYVTEIGQLEKFIRETNPIDVTNITARTIQDFQVSLIGKYKPTTVNHFLKHIRNFLTFAEQQGYTHNNPAKQIRKIKEPKTLPRFLSEEELARFIPVAEKSHLWPLIATGLYAGLRVGELITLKWSDVDLKKCVISVRNPKNKKDRVVPINSRLKAILAPLKQKSGYCFTYAGKPYAQPPKRAISTVYKHASIPSAGFHTLRKTFASYLVMEGISIFKVSVWLGHSDPKITASTYAHLAPKNDSDIESLTFSLHQNK